MANAPNMVSQVAPKMASVLTIDIPLANIVADYNWNGRTLDKSSEEYAGTKASMSEKGQDTPVIVRPIKGKPDKYALTAGFTRLAIATELEWKSLRAEVRDIDDAEARSINARENLTHAQLKISDKAWVIAQLFKARTASLGPDIKVTDDSIAREVGLSVPFINMLRRTATKSATDVFKAWREDKNPLPIQVMLGIIKEPKAKQMDLYREAIKNRDSSGKGEKKKNGWVNAVFKQAEALGSHLGTLERFEVIRITNAKSVKDFDFSVIFDRIPEDATPDQMRAINKGFTEAYVRALEGHEDADDEDSDNDDE